MDPLSRLRPASGCVAAGLPGVVLVFALVAPGSAAEASSATAVPVPGTEAAAGQVALPDPMRSGASEGFDRIGVSPKNLTIENPYFYEYYLRDQHGNPIEGFPASLVKLRFTECDQPTRPLNEIPADGPSDASGRIAWSVGLTFGGADPCHVDLLVQNVLFHTIPGAGVCNQPGDDGCGGVRSPDVNGDGLVALNDLGTFQQCFVEQCPDVYLCDCFQPFDDVCSLNDLRCFQLHFVAP